MGVGAQLVDAFVADARERGAARVVLVTRADDKGAGGFYRRIGWHPGARRTTADGQQLQEFARDLRAR
jgi:ribosomal protein S18 acetylase RimI-like enzyme